MDTNHNFIENIDNKSYVVDVFRNIYTNIQFSRKDKNLKVIMITSPGPNEGKSLVLANLGIVMSRTGVKVLLIDADLRNPTQHALFKVRNVGVSDIVAMRKPVETCIVPTGIENLWLLPAGHIPPNPSEILNSQKALQIILDLKPRFDYILIDTPPVIPVTDACIIGAKVDGAIVLLSSEEVPIAAAVETVKRLRQVGAKILGCVLNKIKVTDECCG